MDFSRVWTRRSASPFALGVAMGELGQQHKSTQQHGGFIPFGSFSYTCYRESLEGSRVTKRVTVLMSVFTECFLRDTPQARFVLCSIKRKLAVSLEPILNT